MPSDHLTPGEQNLRLLEAMIPRNEKLYIWCFSKNGELVSTTCPEADTELLTWAFRIFGGVDKASTYLTFGAVDAPQSSRADNAQPESPTAASQPAPHTENPQPIPLLIGSPIGMQWVITAESRRDQDLFYAAGPVFYSAPSADTIRASLSAYRSDPGDAQWASELIRRLPELPVMPFALFTRYAIMVHNTLTGAQLDVSALLDLRDYATPLATSVPFTDSASRDRTEIYFAERAMLQMVRNGDINYADALKLSSTLSPGVPVAGRDPLQQARISIIVFTSLVVRASMEGGLSPDLAYPLGDAYIDATVRCTDSGQLSEIALTMYHDFIYRVHQLRIDPSYSAAIQKCINYIELNPDKRIKITDLARLTGYTEYYLTQKFKKETGTPLYLYIRRAKVRRAKLMLETTDLSVREIAERLSFGSQTYFIKCFHEIVGLSPAQYRRSARKDTLQGREF